MSNYICSPIRRLKHQQVEAAIREGSNPERPARSQRGDANCHRR